MNADEFRKILQVEYETACERVATFTLMYHKLRKDQNADFEDKSKVADCESCEVKV